MGKIAEVTDVAMALTVVGGIALVGYLLMRATEGLAEWHPFGGLGAGGLGAPSAALAEAEATHAYVSEQMAKTRETIAEVMAKLEAIPGAEAEHALTAEDILRIRHELYGEPLEPIYTAERAAEWSQKGAEEVATAIGEATWLQEEAVRKWGGRI